MSKKITLKFHGSTPGLNASINSDVTYVKHYAFSWVTDLKISQHNQFKNSIFWGFDFGFGVDILDWNLFDTLLSLLFKVSISFSTQDSSSLTSLDYSILLIISCYSVNTEKNILNFNTDENYIQNSKT